MKKLYELEYEVEELRESLINQLEYEDLTLKEVLDLGFNNVYINGIGMYKDRDDDYIADGCYLDDVLLNAIVKYNSCDDVDNNYGNYLEIYCEFEDNKYDALLDAITDEREDN